MDGHDQAELEALRAEVAALRRGLAHVMQRLDTYAAARPPLQPAGSAEPVATGSGVMPDGSIPRRSVLRRAGLVASGVAVTSMGAAAAGFGASPAAAADNQNLVLGVTNTSSHDTIVASGSYSDIRCTLTVLDRAWTDFDPNWILPMDQPAVIGGFAASHRAAVLGQSHFGAQSPSYGVGVVAIGSGVKSVGLETNGVLANMSFPNSGPPPSTRSATVQSGFVVADTNHDLWYCTAAGAPGTWRKLVGPGTAGAFHVLATPVRVHDTRAGNAPLNVTKGKITGAADVVVDAKNGSGVSAGATAVMVNLTATGTSAVGWLALYKNGAVWPGNSTVNWGATGTTIANLAVVATDSLSRFKVRCASGASSDFIVDVIGYYL